LLEDVKVSSSQIEIGTMINIHLNFCLLLIDLLTVFAIVNILQNIIICQLQIVIMFRISKKQFF